VNIKIVAGDFSASLKTYVRNKGTLFWSIAFPVLLILLFGAIYSGGSNNYDIYVKNFDYANGTIITQVFKQSDIEVDFMEDHTNFYDAIYQQFNQTNVTTVRVISDSEARNEKELQEYIQSHKGKIKSLLIIPKDYGIHLSRALTQKKIDLAENMTLMMDPTDGQRNSIILSVVSQFTGFSNLMLAEGNNFIRFNTSSIIQERYEFIDFFIPGIIGLSVMTSGIYGSIERNTKFRKNGILRKLLTTPITRGEWIFAKMLFMLFLAFVSTSVILVVGILVWGVAVQINIYMFILIISASFAFSGLGLIITRFVREEETADSAGGALTFPMMFLAGTFFPLETMPEFLRVIAQALPLYYVNEGLRAAMILKDTTAALWNSIVVFIFAAIVFAVGTIITSWRED
jgi:ABC-2 type transport system permease protein